MNIESNFIKYYSQDDEALAEHIEIYEMLTKEQMFLIQKRFAMDIATVFRELNRHSKAELIKNCNSLRYMQQCIADPTHKHFRGSFCKDRYCPICSHIKSHKETQMLFTILESMKKDNNYKNCYLIFVTLTQKNVAGNELKSEVKKINKAIKKLLKDDELFKPTKRKRDGKMKTEKPLCIGTVRHLEVTTGYKAKLKRIDYHPHEHVILLVRKDYWNQKSKQWTHDKLMKKWREVMELDYDPVVHLTLVKNDGMKSIIEVKDDDVGVVTTDIDIKTAKKNNLASLDADGALKEISKYEAKDTDKIKFVTNKETGRVEINWNDSKEIIGTLYNAFHHTRATVMTGEFLKQKKRLFGDKDADDLIDEMHDSELIDIFKRKTCRKCGSEVTEHLLRYSGKKKVYLELGQAQLENYKDGMNEQIKSIVRRRRLNAFKEKEGLNELVEIKRNLDSIDEDAKSYPFDDLREYLESVYSVEEVDKYFADMNKKN